MEKAPDTPQFTAVGRHIIGENLLRLTSVGIDIGSSTSHLVFSELELKREGTRYVTVNRTVLYASDILLTPYRDGSTIDGDALGSFIARQYEASGLRREEVDTGALILTGVALQRQNARAIGDLFAEEAGRFVAVSAGDNLEATMAAHGSGAVALSARESNTVMSIDIGGGTTKIAVCVRGRVQEVAALNIGARLVVLDREGVVTRIEEAGRQIGEAVGLELKEGRRMVAEEQRAMASYMADQLFQLAGMSPPSQESRWLWRTPPLPHAGTVDGVIFSGGVSEFIYDREGGPFGDLGIQLAEAVKRRVAELGIRVWRPAAGIRATVIGASQYTVQVSGNTIFISPVEAVPVRNVPVVAPELTLDGEAIDAAGVRRAVTTALRRLDLLREERPVAVAFRWEGSATYGRLDALCRGIVDAMRDNLASGNPLVLVCDRDVGGLLGIHLKNEMHLEQAVISIDGIDLREFDYIDIGTLIPSSGSVPVVIKSLVFPAREPG